MVGVAQGRTGMDAALLSTAVLRGQAFKLRVIDHNNLFSDVVIDHRTVVESARGEGGKGEGSNVIHGTLSKYKKKTRMR